MKVKIKNIEPNPFRHLERYPLRQDKLDALKASMKSTGFWDNVVARPNPAVKGKVQIAYGHHRLKVLQDIRSPDDEVDLVVRPLDDPAMLKIMASENMNEWTSSASVEHETVRAVVEAFASGQVVLENVPADAAHDRIRHAPSFRMGKDGRAAAHDRPYTAQTVASFLGWKPDKVKYALMALELIEDGVLDETVFQGLTPEQARSTVVETRKALPGERSAEAAMAKTTDAKRTASKVPGKPQQDPEATGNSSRADQPRDEVRHRATLVGTGIAGAFREGKASTKTAKVLGADLRGEELPQPAPAPVQVQEPEPGNDLRVTRAFADLVASYCADGEILPEVEARYRDTTGLAEQVQAQCRRMGPGVRALWALLSKLGFQP